MDFGFDEVQQDLRDLAGKIIGEQVTAERLKSVEAGEGFDRDLWDQLARANLVGVALPEDVGGSGYGIMELCVLLQEVGRKVAAVPVLPTVAMAALPIAELGTDEQRKRWLPAVIDGECVLTAALQEPGVVNPVAPGTTARQDGSGWRLDGRKVAVPYGPFAERIIVSAQVVGGGAGAAAFLVDPRAEGVTLTPTRGTNREPRGNLVLDGVKVGDEDRVGDQDRVGGGDTVATIYRYALAGICATGVGLLEEAVSVTAGYISSREQFGRPIATFQAAALRAADAFIDIRAASATTWSAIWRLAAGRSADDELAIAKFWIADGGQRVVHACQHLHGGMGVDIDYPIHRYFLWAKDLELTLGGATQQLLRLGASMAGE